MGVIVSDDNFVSDVRSVGVFHFAAATGDKRFMQIQGMVHKRRQPKGRPGEERAARRRRRYCPFVRSAECRLRAQDTPS